MQSISTDATEKTNCKESRLPFAKLSTQATKNIKETIHWVLRDICEVSVIRFDSRWFGATSIKVRVL